MAKKLTYKQKIKKEIDLLWEDFGKATMLIEKKHIINKIKRANGRR
jgi:hypothetical protein